MRPEGVQGRKVTSMPRSREGLGGVEHGVVLDGGGDEVGGFLREEIGLQDAEEGEVVALGAAGGEDDLGGAAVEQRGDLLAGVLDGGAGVLALLVDGAGVAEVLDPEGTHGVEDLGEQRRGGVGVHVDPAHGSSLRLSAGAQNAELV